MAVGWAGLRPSGSHCPCHHEPIFVRRCPWPPCNKSRRPAVATVPDGSEFLCLFDHLRREAGGDNPVCCWLKKLEKVADKNPGQNPPPLISRRQENRQKERAEKERTDRQ